MLTSTFQALVNNPSAPTSRPSATLGSFTHASFTVSSGSHSRSHCSINTQTSLTLSHLISAPATVISAQSTNYGLHPSFASALRTSHCHAADARHEAQVVSLAQHSMWLPHHYHCMLLQSTWISYQAITWFFQKMHKPIVSFLCCPLQYLKHSLSCLLKEHII